MALKMLSEKRMENQFGHELKICSHHQDLSIGNTLPASTPTPHLPSSSSSSQGLSKLNNFTIFFVVRGFNFTNDDREREREGGEEKGQGKFKFHLQRASNTR